MESLLDLQSIQLKTCLKFQLSTSPKSHKCRNEIQEMFTEVKFNCRGVLVTGI